MGIYGALDVDLLADSLTNILTQILREKVGKCLNINSRTLHSAPWLLGCLETVSEIFKGLHTFRFSFSANFDMLSIKEHVHQLRNIMVMLSHTFKYYFPHSHTLYTHNSDSMVS